MTTLPVRGDDAGTTALVCPADGEDVAVAGDAGVL
jgi:hypothetical protein